MTASAPTTPGPVPVSWEALEVLRSDAGNLTHEVNCYLEETLTWYRHLSTDERASLRLIAQRGIGGLISWLENPSSRSLPLVNELLGNAPTDLMRTISLQRALQLIRSIVEAVEQRLPGLVAPQDQQLMLEAVLRYSREVAFAIADVYARAAESRGAWDSRLEALLVDAVLRGEPAEQIASRAAAVGWRSHEGVVVVVGDAPEQADAVFMSQLRRQCIRFSADAVVGVHGDRLILLLGRVTDLADGLERILPRFGPGQVVFSSFEGSISQAHGSAQSAFTGFTAVGAWTSAPRPVAAEDLLPERALCGDETAKTVLRERIFEVLRAAGNGLLETVTAYLEAGHSLEATARELFVHTNTVRYRLRRVTDVTGWDPVTPRDAYVLQTALAVGRL
ncbi:helix-turn-helix domain-containing protein [Nesterenkonia sp. E16_7]|uniref:PucR family transcriptional regulator n=1 Tax=unclassified Nesterenkonia TaxID=2629769 RepID=UPI001A92185C|nr:MULTISPECIES: helix-turn-helix domain-containing protein [unclassified Nesterenkonia]MBO0596078.1 helix-turn-helix domain-containing protein [Nesterenkonia sp. E16_10]MBO0599320.1 helix-turn-helix domain-containing protein [Nesterenkonia sp. E16_7]